MLDLYSILAAPRRVHNPKSPRQRMPEKRPRLSVAFLNFVLRDDKMAARDWPPFVEGFAWLEMLPILSDPKEVLHNGFQKGYEQPKSNGPCKRL